MVLTPGVWTFSRGSGSPFSNFQRRPRFRGWPVAVVGVGDHSILPAVADGHEFVGDFAAHHAGVGLDREDVFHPDPAEDPFVCLVAAEVVGFEVLLVGVEAVGVLHGEFAHPDQSGAGPRLVAVLGLDLVEHDRELVAVEFGAHEVDDSLLVGHRQQHRLVVAVAEASSSAPTEL